MWRDWAVVCRGRKFKLLVFLLTKVHSRWRSGECDFHFEGSRAEHDQFAGAIARPLDPKPKS